MHTVHIIINLFLFSDGTINSLDERVLTISPFTFEEEGSYVCRTENIAGEDADVVSLTAGKMMLVSLHPSRVERTANRADIDHLL